MLIASSIVYGVLLFYQVVMLFARELNVFTAVNLLVMAGFLVLNIIWYRTNPLSVSYKTLVLAELVIQFLFFLIATDASFIGTIMIGVLGTTIPYYSKKYFNATFIAFIILFLIGQFVRQIMGVTDPSVSGICNVVVTIAVMVVMFALSNICKIFSDHSLAAIDEQRKEHQKYSF